MHNVKQGKRLLIHLTGEGDVIAPSELSLSDSLYMLSKNCKNAIRSPIHAFIILVTFVYKFYRGVMPLKPFLE